VFRFAGRGAILTGKRRGKKWVYIAAGLMGGGRWKSQRMQAGRGWVVDECARVFGDAAATITIFVISWMVNVGAGNADLWMRKVGDHKVIWCYAG